MGQNNEDVEDLKSEGRDGQKIDRHHAVEVIAKESLLVGRNGPTRASCPVFGDGSVGDSKAEVEQFAVDAGSAPQRIGAAHLPDQVDGVRADRLAPRFTRLALPTPEELEPRAIPMNDRARLNEAEPDLPIRPGLREPSPEGTVQRGHARAFVGAAEDQELVPQSEVFEEEIPAGIEPGESNLNHHC